MEATQSITQMVDEFDRTPTGSTTIVSLDWIMSKECRRTNKALDNMDDKDKLIFLSQFLTLWSEAKVGQEKFVQLHATIGYEHDHLLGSRLMYTYTSDRRQFRCWYGIPKSFRYDHVDSCGEGLLFTVVGDPETVRKYADTLISEKAKERAIRIPFSECTIYNLF
jgi:hypothetical protein